MSQSTYTHEYKTYPHTSGEFGSWKVVNEDLLIKCCDEVFFKFNGIVVPNEICWFFNAEDLILGESMLLKLIFNKTVFTGRINNTRGTFRIQWRNDLGAPFNRLRNGRQQFVGFKRMGERIYQMSLDGYESEDPDFERFTLAQDAKEGELREYNVNLAAKDVLVGSVGSREQLITNIINHFYYVPVKNLKLPARPVKRVALYQSYYSKAPGIRYYADIKAVKRVLRRDIPVTVRHNNEDEEYYLFLLGPWHYLRHTIEIKTDTVQKPKFTNSFLLTHCTKAYELFNINTNTEYRLALELNRMYENAKKQNTIELIRFNREYSILLDTKHIMLLDALQTPPTLDSIVEFSTDEYEKHPKKTFNQIKKYFKGTFPY